MMAIMQYTLQYIYHEQSFQLHFEYKPPFYLLFKEEPGLHVLKMFDTLTYASTFQFHRIKLDHKGKICIFLGLKQGVKGVILLDISNKYIFILRNVVHYEHIFHIRQIGNITRILTMKLQPMKLRHLHPIIQNHLTLMTHNMTQPDLSQNDPTFSLVP